MRKKVVGDQKMMKTCYIDRNSVKQDLGLKRMWIRRNSNSALLVEAWIGTATFDNSLAFYLKFEHSN